MNQNQYKKQILIVGGGTAGWMAASLLQHHLSSQGFNIALLESDNIATVGVGEGSTPYIKQFFQTLGIDEKEWMSKCDATFKSGITFKDWSTRKGFTQYFHPFTSSIDPESYDIFRQVTHLRHKNFRVESHPDQYFLQSELIRQRRLPISTQPSHVNSIYAYHFNAGKLGEYLKKRAIKLGVQHLIDDVIDVNLSLSGDIASIMTASGRELKADIFIDCTGFKSLLIEKALKVPFTSFKDNLFNDAAVTVASEAKNSYSPQTISTAMTAGWRWDIPLTSRTGNGYVYSSDFINAEQAEQELKQAINLTNANVEVRHIKMKVGRLDKHWHKNCVAIGLSQGFIEPLEATALHIVQLSIEQFIEQYKQGSFTNKHQDFYNHGVNHMFEHIRDYIVLHYLTNSRNDSAYWRACRHDIKLSDRLQAAMEVWCSGGDLDQELHRQQVTQYYSSMSWYVLLAGMGIFPNINSSTAQVHEQADRELNNIRTRLKSYANFFPFSR